MTASWPSELIVVARANFVEDEGGRRFQNLDGAYLDAIAPCFRQVIILAPVFRRGRDPQYDSLKNYSYRFQAPNIEVREVPEAQLRRQCGIIRATLREFPRALLYAFFPTFRAAYAALWCRWQRRPYFVYSGVAWPEVVQLAGGSAGKATLCAWLEAGAFGGAAARIFTPAVLLRKFAAAGLTERARPVTNVRLLPEFPARRAKPPLRLLCVGGLMPRKGHDTLYAAMAALRRRGIATTLTLAGTADEGWKRQLDVQAEQLGIRDWITYRGWLSDSADLARLYAAADIFVLPTRAEGFPRVIFEAMGHGVPVVSTTIPNIAGVVDHEENALLVPPDDPVALAATIERLAGDELLRARLARVGWEWAREQFRETPGEQFRRILARARLDAGSREGR